MNKQLEKLINDYDTIVMCAGVWVSAASDFEYGGKPFWITLNICMTCMNIKICIVFNDDINNII